MQTTRELITEMKARAEEKLETAWETDKAELNGQIIAADRVLSILDKCEGGETLTCQSDPAKAAIALVANYEHNEIKTAKRNSFSGKVRSRLTGKRAVIDEAVTSLRIEHDIEIPFILECRSYLKGPDHCKV
jgi:hypothetical protein